MCRNLDLEFSRRVPWRWVSHVRGCSDCWFWKGEKTNLAKRWEVTGQAQKEPGEGGEDDKGQRDLEQGCVPRGMEKRVYRESRHEGAKEDGGELAEWQDVGRGAKERFRHP